MILLLEDKKLTSMMRRLDLFEDFKFIGIQINTDNTKNKFIKKWIETDEFAITAQIINNKYKINPAYENSLISDGKSFCYLKQLCELITKE